ncbi:MAG: hypothetical protein JWM34_5065 [Ilumatobacteraceae bacterium]|nr:hypothetical protein [Ilumatobacteraceae bacterium]
MNTPTLEQRLREHYTATADELVLNEFSFSDLILPTPTTHQLPNHRRRVALAAAAAVLSVSGAGGVLLARSSTHGQAPAAASGTDAAHASNASVTTAAPIDTATPTTALTADQTERRGEGMPYVLSSAAVGAPNDNIGYVDPATGAVGRTFVSDDGLLSRILVVMTFPLNSPQLPAFTGDPVGVPVGTARLDQAEVAGQTTFQWRLSDQMLTIRSIGMTQAQTVAAAVEYRSNGAVAQMRLDSVWGNDRTLTNRDYYAAADPADESAAAAGPDTTNPAFPWSLRIMLAPPYMGWPNGPAAQRTTVLGQPAWRWRTNLADPSSPTFVTWEIPGNRRWMELIAPTPSIDAALAALQPGPVLSTRPVIGRLDIPSIDGNADVVDGVSGDRLDQLTNGTAIHDSTTGLPQYADNIRSLVYLSDQQFHNLGTVTVGSLIDWTSTAETKTTFTVASVRSIAPNTDPYGLTDSGLIIVSDPADPGSGEQTVIIATPVTSSTTTTTH